MKHTLRLGLVPAYLTLCLLLGGASGGGFWANLALQLLALPILIWGIVARRSTPMTSAARSLIVLLSVATAVVLIQLVPLPPSLWTILPGREPIAKGFELLGRPLPWMPLSLAPSKTVASALWMLPAVAVLLGILRIGGFKPSWLAASLLVVTAASVGLGALQLSAGAGSPLYFYRITNADAAVGFFANTNNMAELLVVAIPFLGAVYLSASKRGSSVQRTSGLLTVLLGALAVLLVGILVNRSLAGLGLMIPTIAATALMLVFRRRQAPSWSGLLVVALLVGSVALVLGSGFGNNLTTSEARQSTTSRYTSFNTTIEAAGDYLPVGSGLGTFPQIYPMYEDPQQVDRWYMNHAHNDYLELWLEFGVPGAALILAFLMWWLWRVVRVWRATDPDPFARAATIGSAVILAHSFVEFPLRTAAISAVFAVCLALMAEARPRARGQQTSQGSAPRARHISAD
ncbi:O-antigen ligase family protein [Sphingomonas parva]|uniref:O-antigen ligase family protein n=1 Tax=Sphingomonas parva TaxID=2555898 RepID=A0A4Y8ZV59_9SPHN|nr:O-antigen ligase family protein [Sphingomonas parva]TFI59908.1 O-antigen ligase family protein [Sphingomonas parva]